MESADGDLPVTPRTKKVFNLAFDEARLQGVNYVGTEHLLLALLREEEGVAGQVLTGMGIRLDSLREQVMTLLGGEVQSNPNAAAYQEPPANHSHRRRPANARLKARLLPWMLSAAFGPRIAAESRLDPVIGRNKEIERWCRYYPGGLRTTRFLW
jgi:ATP-dependent Clp protease ATP-binding subunit ClpC